jgi:hypothetical protein
MSWRGERQTQPYELDYNDQLRQAYYDCVVSLNSLETVQFSAQGISTFQNQVAITRFSGTVDILASMIVDNQKDDDYRKVVPDEDGFSFDPDNPVQGYRQALVRFHAITELFYRKKILKGPRGFSGRV